MESAAPRTASLRGAPLQALALGLQYSCALLDGGAVKCWGSDEYGVLGRDGPRQDVADPSTIEPIDFGTSRQVVRVSAGWHHACVLFDDGKARCWGHNDRGQLGRQSRDDYGDDPGESLSTEEDLPLDHILDISAGVSNTCAIIAPQGARVGNVHCWGSDTNGGIGDTDSGDFGDDEALTVLRPVALDGQLARSVVVGDSVGCALLEDGDVRCWGNNAWGTLGTNIDCNIGDERVCEGTTEPRPIRSVQGLGEAFITSLYLNQAHACALDNTGALRCWGRNDESRAGYPEARLGNKLGQTPGRVNLGADASVVQVGLGTRHGCALDARGGVRCWGEAGPQLGYGQMQNNDIAGIGGTLEPGEQYAQMDGSGLVQLVTSDEAASAEGAPRVSQLFVGGFHACAILGRAGTFAGLRCWGHNELGELGYGSYERVGNIGATDSPAREYEQRLDHPDVCVVRSADGPCARGRG